MKIKKKKKATLLSILSIQLKFWFGEKNVTNWSDIIKKRKTMSKFKVSWDKLTPSVHIFFAHLVKNAVRNPDVIL